MIHYNWKHNNIHIFSCVSLADEVGGGSVRYIIYLLPSQLSVWFVILSVLRLVVFQENELIVDVTVFFIAGITRGEGSSAACLSSSLSACSLKFLSTLDSMHAKPLVFCCHVLVQVFYLTFSWLFIIIISHWLPSYHIQYHHVTFTTSISHHITCHHVTFIAIISHAIMAHTLT